MRTLLCLVPLLLGTLSGSALAQVTITVHSAATPAATRSAIANALAAVNTTGGTIYFPDALYEIDAGILLWDPADDVLLASSAPAGVRPVIRYVGAAHINTLFLVGELRSSLAIEGLAWDANYLASQVVRISKLGATDQRSAAQIVVQDCAFSHGRQRVWDQGGQDPYGVDRKWGHEDLSVGVWVSGAFSSVALRRCVFEDFGHIASSVEPPTHDKSVGSRGALIDAYSDPHPNAPIDYAERVRHVEVSDCIFVRVRSVRFQHLPGGELIPLDADGLHISILRVLPGGGGIVPHEEGSATVCGSTFNECEYRSVKLQVRRAIVSDNTFIRNSNGQCEIDSQYGGADVFRNSIAVQGSVTLRGAGLVQAAFRTSAPSPFNVSGNTFVLPPGVGRYNPIGVSSDNVAIRDVFIANNVVQGESNSLVLVWQPPGGFPHSLSVTGNRMMRCTTSLIVVASPGAGAVVRGVFADNRSVLPSMQSALAFQPDCWAQNKGVAFP